MASSSGKRRHRSVTASELTPPPAWRRLWTASIPALAAVVFAQVYTHSFLQFDDADYVTQNPAVRSGLTLTGLQWAFTTSHAGNWHPLTWLSHMADVQLFGMHAGWHLLVSAGLHALTSLLLLRLLFRITGRFFPSLFVAAAFAVHPLHVESVAWVAERKDVLSTFWWMLAIGAYANYVRRPKPRRYAAVAIFFVLALLSKPMVVTLPVVLLLLDVWPFRRWQPFGTERRAEADDGWLPVTAAVPLSRLIKEKALLIVLAVAVGAVTFIVQRQAGAVQSMEAFPIALRFANVPVAYVTYLAKTIWPANLVALYPYPELIPVWRFAGALLLLAGITFWVWRRGRARPYLAVGWLWFLITLMPVIGVIQVGSQPYADRYTYVPSIGLFIMIAWGAADVAAVSGSMRRFFRVAAPAIVGALAILAFRQVGVWRNSVSLWEHAVAVTPTNYRAHTNLGFALAEERATDRALAAYREAIRLEPDFARVRNYYGALLRDSGSVQTAVGELRAAIALQPRFIEAHNNLGLALAALGQTADAISAFREAVRLDPTFAPAWNNLGIALASERQFDAAIAAFRESLKYQPDSAESHFNLALALEDAGRPDDARPHFETARRLNPKIRR